MSDSIVTQLTAVYAALVSTAIATWTFYRDWNDRGKLRVSVRFMSIAGNGEIEDNILVWSVTNIGRRSVLLTHVGGIGKQKTGAAADNNENFLVNDSNLPKRLEPGDYHMSLLREYDLKGELGRLIAGDSVGGIFDAPKNEVIEVKKRIRELSKLGILRSRVRPS